MRRNIILSIAAFAFLCATGILLYRTFGNYSDQTARNESIAAELDTLSRIQVFMGDDGVTFSSDQNYKYQNIAIAMSRTELASLGNRLTFAGLLQEAPVNSTSDVHLPVDHSITLTWPHRKREFRWLTGDDCRVPEKYLQILEELNETRDIPFLWRFIAANRKQAKVFPSRK